MRMVVFIGAPCVAASTLGAQWTPQASGTTAEFRGLVAVTPSIVWASGTNGRVARTIDGGKTWRVDSVPGAARLDLRGISAALPNRAWAISSGPADSGQAQIFHADDGRHWIKQFETKQPGAFLDAISFWDNEHGIALSDPVAGRLFVLTTNDGGASWTRVPTDNAPAMLPSEAAFAASGTCLIVKGTSNVWIGTGGGARARVFRSSDRGRTWSVADTPIHAGNATSGVFSVAFDDAQHGVAVGGDYNQPTGALENVAVTSDGGRTWRLAAGMPHAYLSAVAYIPETNGRSLVAVGLGGTARSTDGGGNWTLIDTVAYNSVAFASRDAGWAAGPSGRIAKWSPPRAKKP